jgi:hypothetical protein
MDSDFPIPYAWVDRILPLPAPEGSTLLQRFITSHGKKAAAQGPNLADNKVQYITTSQKNWLTVLYKYILGGFK